MIGIRLTGSGRRVGIGVAGAAHDAIFRRRDGRETGGLACACRALDNETGRRVGRGSGGFRPGEGYIPHVGRYSTGCKSRSGREGSRDHEDHRPHHVVFFMTQQVAVPYVFPTEVGHHVALLGHRRNARRRRNGIEVRRGTQRRGFVEQPHAVGKRERQRHVIRLDRHNDVFLRVCPDDLSPPDFVRVGLFYDVGEVNPVDHLQVEQVEVQDV